MPRTADDKLANYIWDRDTPYCVYCQKLGQVIDHVMPYKYNGPTIQGNLVLACISCNSKKSGRLSIEHLVRGFYHLLEKGESLEWLNEMWSLKETNPLMSALYVKINSISFNQTSSTVVPLVDKELIGKEKKKQKYWEKCMNCQKWAEVNIKNLHYCSITCRQAYWRKQKQ